MGCGLLPLSLRDSRFALAAKVASCYFCRTYRSGGWKSYRFYRLNKKTAELRLAGFFSKKWMGR
jgi:hypothetical protein